VTELGLTPETANLADLLGRSEGRRHTDRIETVLAAEPAGPGGDYVTHFLVRGVRHVPGAEAVALALRADDQLQATLEATNPVNPLARMLRFRGEAVGYVPDYLLSDLEALDAARSNLVFTVVKVNPPPTPAHHRLLVRLDAGWPRGFQPFAGADFAPVVAPVNDKVLQAS
jgi:hypothetical protein